MLSSVFPHFLLFSRQPPSFLCSLHFLPLSHAPMNILLFLWFIHLSNFLSVLAFYSLFPFYSLIWQLLFSSFAFSTVALSLCLIPFLYLITFLYSFSLLLSLLFHCNSVSLSHSLPIISTFPFFLLLFSHSISLSRAMVSLILPSSFVFFFL